VQDIDWAGHRISIIRSKSGHRDILPLEPSVERAISRYVSHARPRSDHPALSLTVRAPFRPLSPGALYDIVASRIPTTDRPRKGRGPHGLRHACARHLVDAGCPSRKSATIWAIAVQTPHGSTRRSISPRCASWPSTISEGSYDLASAVQTYVGLKQSLGAVFSVDARILAAFVRAVGDVSVSTITGDVHRVLPRSRSADAILVTQARGTARPLSYLVGRGAPEPVASA
jgi:hypothetical protein